LLVKLTHIS